MKRKVKLCSCGKSYQATNAICPKCYQQNNKHKIRARRSKTKQLLDNLKVYYGCMNPACSWQVGFHPRQLDYHHIGEKRVSLGQVGRHYALSTLAAEINKCCVLCANCHRLVTAGELDGSFPLCNVIETLQPYITP